MKRTIYQYVCLLISLLQTGIFWLGIILISQMNGDVTSSVFLAIITALALVAFHFLIDATVRGLYGVNWYIHLAGILVSPVRLLLQIVTIVVMHTCDDEYFGERKDYESHRLISSLMYSLFTASSLSFSGWSSSDRAARHRFRGYEKQSRKAKRKAHKGDFLESIKDFFVELWQTIVDFVLRFVIPTVIVLAVLAALLLLPDYHSDIGAWRSADLDRLVFLLFSVISSIVLMFAMYSEEGSGWLWTFCFLATALTVSFLKPHGALSSALAFYGNVFFIVFSIYFLLFVGIFNFPYEIDEIARKAVIIISGATLLISCVLAFILAPKGIYLPSKLTFAINETQVPIPILLCGVFLVIATIFDKTNIHVSVGGSTKAKSANLIQMEQAAKGAASAVPYVEFGNVTGGTVTMYVTVSGYEANKQEKWFMEELRGSLNGLSTSGWKFQFLHK